jgi:hypothetical protein
MARFPWPKRPRCYGEIRRTILDKSGEFLMHDITENRTPRPIFERLHYISVFKKSDYRNSR